MAVNAAASSWMLSQPASKSERRSPFAAPYSWKAMLSCPEPPRTSSLPAPPSTQSVPVLPLTKSLPAPPLTVSVPSPPSKESLPPLPLITSLSAPPVIVSLASVPLNVAMSDHPDVWRYDGCRALYGCHDLRIGAPGAICVVIKRASRRVVDDAVVRIMSAGRSRAGKEPCIAGRKVARPAERAEGGRVQAQRVPTRVEVEQRVGVAGAEFSEHITVLARSARELIVAGAAFEPV